jgi:hypothetical protein
MCLALRGGFRSRSGLFAAGTSRAESSSLFARELTHRISTISINFPHKNMFCETFLESETGVLSIHRKRDLPAEESRRRATQENRQRDSRSDRATGSGGGHEKALTIGQSRKSQGNAGASSREPDKLRDKKVVVWKPNQTFKKSGQEGRQLARVAALSHCAVLVAQQVNHAQLESL